jgi:RimJ/RimL family protein N-acetyltransferase
MSETDRDLALRTATIDDAAIVADLEAAREPEDPRDPVVLRFWWVTRPPDEAHMQLVAERDGSALAFVGAGHDPWEEGNARRFGWIRPVLHPRIWTASEFGKLIDAAESWLRQEQATTSVGRLREDFVDQLRVYEERGYQEVRRSKVWELDLSARRGPLIAGAERSRKAMANQGVRLMTLDRYDDPDRMNKLYELTVAAEGDIPTTVPLRAPPFDEWYRMWFENPGVREDRFWVAREGDSLVGLSVIGYPPTRGLPWTFFTATSQSVRGRGVARALKYETLAQAIELGTQRVRTMNDGENEPILHLNAEMGYRPVNPVVELHHELNP